MRESDILRACLRYLHALNWLAWRNNSGAMSVGQGAARRHVRFNGADGSSDLFAVAPDGRFVAIETKRPGNKPTPTQAHWLAQVAACGGLAIVATSLDDMLGALERAGYDMRSRATGLDAVPPTPPRKRRSASAIVRRAPKRPDQRSEPT